MSSERSRGLPAGEFEQVGHADGIHRDGRERLRGGSVSVFLNRGDGSSPCGSIRRQSAKEPRIDTEALSVALGRDGDKNKATTKNSSGFCETNSQSRNEIENGIAGPDGDREPLVG